MNTDYFSFDGLHLLGDSAARPIEPLATRPGSLLRLAGMSLRRYRACRAQPWHSHGSLELSKRAQARFDPQLSPYPDTLPAAHSGASN